ncbi:MAG: GntR family transcriptional regulator [Ruminococcus sp.]|nr:GntR family transcriptional regulator [Ruminococcus sp.]
MYSIDLTSRVPIYEQICQKITGLVLSGTLAENDQLPSVRSFAKSSGVNPNTVAKAYQELERSGIIYSVPGRGSFISKPDSESFQRAAMEEFGNAAAAALRCGITKTELKEYIDHIDERKENET